MATATLRPNATNYNSGWTVVGASAHGAVDDDPVDDATYVQAAAGCWLLVYDLGALALPAYAQIRSVAVRARRRGNSSAVLDVSVGYQPPSGSYRHTRLSIGEKPSSTIATKTYGSLVAAPGGARWDNDAVIPNLQVSFGANNTNIRVYEVYVDVVYAEAPTCVITSPTGDIIGSQVPSVSFVYSSPEGATQERAQVKIFTAAQVAAAGFIPDVSAAFWDSGQVLTSAASLKIGKPLPSGDYAVYARVSDAGSSGRFGPWADAEFTVGGGLPAAPSLAVSADSTGRRNTLTATQRDNYLSYGQSTMAAAGGEGDGWYADENTVLSGISADAPTATTRAETFTGADGALSGANTDLNWTVMSGAFAVSSNQLTSSTANAIAWLRLDDTVPSSDHYAQFVVNTLAPSTNRTAMLWLRVASSGITGYVVELKEQFDQYVIWRVTGGVWHGLFWWKKLPQPLATPATWRAEIRGNKISVKLNGVLLGTHELDGVITTGTRAGIAIYNGGSSVLLDSFEAGDLDAVVSGGDAVSGTGDYLLEMTCTAARQGRAYTGGRYGWGAPVTPGEQLTVMARAWQRANAARSARVDVEYFDDAGDPLANAVFSEDWTGTDGAAWDADWTTSHAGAATSSIQANAGRMVTGTTAYGSPARAYASGMTAIADCEVTCLVVCSSTTAEMRGLVAVRTDGTYNGAAPSYPAAGYMVEIDPQNDVILVRRAGVGVPTLATPGKTVPAEGLYVRLRVVGTTIAAKAWAATAQEPAVWDWVGEDSTWAAAGKVTLTAQNGADALARTVTFDGLVVDDLTRHSFGAAFTTNTDSTMAAHSRDVVVPAGASYASMVLRAFPTGGGEVFVWDRAGLMPGAGREWSRGGLMVGNMYTANESTFEVPGAGVAGWAASTDAAVARVNFVAPATNPEAAPAASGAIVKLSWTGGTFPPAAVYAYGPAKPAVAGLDYAVRAWLYRIDPVVSLLRLGLRFTDSSGGELAVSLGADVLPDAGVWAGGTHTARAPEGTALVQVAVAASPVQSGSAAVTRVCLAQGTEAPAAFQPGPASLGYALAEYSDDGGQVWEQVRDTTRALYGLARVVTLHDNEAPPGAARLYRASTAAVDYLVDPDGGATVVSEPSAEVSATLPASGFWLRDPLVPCRLLRVKISGDLDYAGREPQEVHFPLGRDNAVVVSDGPKGEEFTVPLAFLSHNSFRQFEEMRRESGALLFQTDYGDQWYVKLGPSRRVVLKRSSARADIPVRMVEVTFTEVDRPDPGLSNAGVVTGVVWEGV